MINRNISARAEKVFIQMPPIRAHFKKMANENVTSHGLKSTENVAKRRFRPEKKDKLRNLVQFKLRCKSEMEFEAKTFNADKVIFSE